MELNQKPHLSTFALSTMAGTLRLIMRDNDLVKSPNLGHAIMFFSEKCNRSVTVMSRLELERVRQLEADPKVTCYQERPFRIEYTDAGKLRSVSPDFAVFLRNGSRTVEEVMSEKNLMRPEVVRRLALEKTLLRKHGYTLRVVVTGKNQEK